MGSIYLGNTLVGVAQTYTTADLNSLQIQNKTITPTTTTQTVSVDTGYDCLGEVTVRAVTSSIDSNITASNVRSGTEILGVLGTLVEAKPEQTKTATLSTSGNVLITPSTGYTLSSVVVPQVTSDIDNNITASNIKAGIRILGVEGTYETPAVITTITPSTSLQTVTPSTGYVFSQVTVPAVTSSIDANISGGNIKSGVSILGITGTYETPAVNVTVNPSKVLQTINPIQGQHFNTITVDPVTASIDQNIIASNIKRDINILGVTGTYAPTVSTKTITPSASTITYTASTESLDGYSSVTINGDADLTPDNIKKDVNIFGVTGTAKTITYKYFNTPMSDFTKNLETATSTTAAHWAFSGSDSEGLIDYNPSIQFEFNFSGSASGATCTYDGDGIYTIRTNASGVTITKFYIYYNRPTFKNTGTSSRANPYYDVGFNKHVEVELYFSDEDEIGYDINHYATYFNVRQYSVDGYKHLPRTYTTNKFDLGYIYSIEGYSNDSATHAGTFPSTFSFRVRYVDYDYE